MKFSGAKVKWFGHSAFQIESPEGKKILIDPWLNSPGGSDRFIGELDGADIVLITHGHSDHIGNTVELAKKFNPEIYCIFEVAQYLSLKGVNAVGMNIGGCIERDGIEMCMVEASHSSAMIEDGEIIYLGNPAGFVITLENGFKIYHAGDTGLFGGLELIANFYKPDLVMVPIGGHFTLGPREAAYAVSILRPKYIIPMHFGTFPLLKGTPEAFINALPPEYKDKVIVPEAGKTIE